MKLLGLPLLVWIVVAIGLGVALGGILPYGMVRLFATFNGVFGNDIYNNLANVEENRSFLGDGYNTTLKAANNTAEAIGNPAEYSSRYIEDGSYLRLASATLGYTFNLKPNNYISALRVYLTGNNLFCITSYSGYDPEVDALRTTNGIPTMGIGWTQYPKARSFSLGMNIQF